MTILFFLILTLFVLSFLLLIPLGLLIRFLSHATIVNGEIGLLRKIIKRVSIAKFIYISGFVIIDFLALFGINPVSILGTSFLIMIVGVLFITNWWALIKIRDINKH